eukprot:850494_1
MRVEAYTSSGSYKPNVRLSTHALIRSMPDDAFTATASNPATTCLPHFSRSTSAGAWCAVSANDYLQVDLAEQYSIGSVSVFPCYGVDQWVTKYTLSYSTDGVGPFTAYPQTLNGPQSRTGDDSLDEARSVLDHPIVARYLKFTPLSFVGAHKAMRVEAYTSSGSYKPNVRLSTHALIRSMPDDAFTATASNPATTCLPHFSRSTSAGAWCAVSANDYLQVDLAEQYSIGSVSVFPCYGVDQWVTKYTLSYSTDGVEPFTSYPQTLNGPQSRTGDDFLDEARSALDHPIAARYLRFTPVVSYAHASMRVEAYTAGCSHSQDVQVKCSKPVARYVGCYSPAGNAVLTVNHQSDDKDYNMYKCHSNCMMYKYFGIKNGGEYCACDNSLDAVGKVDDLSCDTPTATSRMGGTLKHSVYENQFEFVNVKITGCSGYSMSSSSANTFRLQLRGANDESRYFFVNVEGHAELPTGGNVLSYDSKDSGFHVAQDFGDLYWIKISWNDPNDPNENAFYCVTKISIVISGKEFSFGSDYFGDGLFLSKLCPASFITGHNAVQLDSSAGVQSFFSCESGEVQLNTYYTRAVMNVAFHTCVTAGSGLDNTLLKGVHAAVTGKLKTRRYASEIVYLDAAGSWNDDEKRVYQFNMETPMLKIIAMALNNPANGDDTLCIDEISSNNAPARHLSRNTIGGANADDQKLYAVFEYPVCGTKVVGVRIDIEHSKGQILQGDSTIIGLQCSNFNRMISTTCSVEQAYTLTKTTSFSISSESTATGEYSWGLESSVTTGKSTTEIESTTNTASTTDEFSWGLSVGATVEASVSSSVGTEVEGGVVKASAGSSIGVTASASVGASTDWSSSKEQGSERSTGTERTDTHEQTDAISYSATSSQSKTDAWESSYEQSKETAITCAAEVEVPPSHSISYVLVFNAIETTIRTYTDLRLTLCSAFVDPVVAADREKHYIYIDNIPGVIHQKETTACIVDFGVVKYLRNDMTCADEQRLAIAIGATYIPLCDASDPAYYDGCQCEIVDKWTEAVCYCVDEKGNIKDAKTKVVNTNWAATCVSDLMCANSGVTLQSQWFNYLNPDRNPIKKDNPDPMKKDNPIAIKKDNPDLHFVNSNPVKKDNPIRRFVNDNILVLFGIVVVCACIVVLWMRRGDQVAKYAHGYEEVIGSEEDDVSV